MTHIENVLMDSKLTVLVNTCDAYEDIWPMFFSALEEYWPDRKYNIVLNTESKEVSLDVKGLTTHVFKNKNGQDQWGRRLISTLESINSEYVIALYDDFILEAEFDSAKLESLIKFMDVNKNIAAMYLIKAGLATDPEEQYQNQELVLDKVDYRLNSAPAIWRRSDLIHYTGVRDTPWAWEVFGSYRTFGDGKLFYTPVDAKNDLYVYNYKKGGAIYRGKWVAEVVENKKEKYSLEIDFGLRGFANENVNEKRSLAWKLKFILLGFRMVGLKAFYFFLHYLKAKLKQPSVAH